MQACRGAVLSGGGDLRLTASSTYETKAAGPPPGQRSQHMQGDDVSKGQGSRLLLHAAYTRTVARSSLGKTLSVALGQEKTGARRRIRR